MELKHEEHGVRLVIPDRLTVRQHLHYDGALGFAQGADQYVRLWAAAKSIITEWECEILALEADLDTLTDRKAAEIIEWAGLAVYSHVRKLEDVEKN